MHGVILFVLSGDNFHHLPVTLAPYRTYLSVSIPLNAVDRAGATDDQATTK